MAKKTDSRHGISGIFRGQDSFEAHQNMTGQFSTVRGALPMSSPNEPNPFMYPISASQDMGTLKTGHRLEAADVTNVTPFFHTPGNAQDAYQLPKSYVEQIRWSRLMYNLNAFIAAITDLKAFYPLSKFRLETSEPFVTEFYSQVAFNRRFNLYKFICRANLMRHKFGEFIAWGSKKQDGVWAKTGKPRWVWDNFILLEPELVEIKKSVIGDPEPKYYLRPNRDLEEIVKGLDSNNKEFEHLRGQISESVMQKVRKKELIQLDASTISSVQNLTDASALRGTPPYQRLYVTYIYEDFIRLAQMAQAQRYHFPVELWTVGNLTDDPKTRFMPTSADLHNVRDMIAEAISKPPFAIFYPPLLKYEALGVQGHLLNMADDYDYIWKQYTVGLGVNEDIIFGTSSIFSSADSSGNQAFIRARKKERDELVDWMIYHFFQPLAEWNNLNMVKGEMLAPILPNIEWEKTLDFKAEEDEWKKDWDLYKDGKLPTEDILVKAGKNPEEIRTKLEKEFGTVFDDGKRVLAPELRARRKATGATPGEAAPGENAPSQESAVGGGGEAAGAPAPAGGGAPASADKGPAGEEAANPIPEAAPAPAAGGETSSEGIL
jgi:hypothetical protein